MYNEHSVCEREIEDLKEQVEYYKMLHQNEYEARQRLMQETKRYKNVLEEIRDHKANSWYNDRKFIGTKLQVLDKSEGEEIHLNASVVGKNVIIKIPVETLVTAFDNNPNNYDEAIKVKFKRKFAEGFATYVNEFSSNSESGLTVLQEWIDEIFDEMISSDEPYIIYPKED